MLEKMSGKTEVSSIKENIRKVKESNINEQNAEDFYNSVVEQVNVIQTQVSRDLNKIEDKKEDANEMEMNLRNVGIIFEGKEGEYISKLKSIINSYDSAVEFDALKFDICFQLLRQQNIVLGSMKGMHVSSEITERFNNLIEKVFDENRKGESNLREQYQKNQQDQFERMFQLIKDMNDKFIERMTMNDLILKQMVSAIGGTQKDFDSIKAQLSAMKERTLVYTCSKCNEKFRELSDLDNHKKIHELDEMKKRQEEEMENRDKDEKKKKNLQLKERALQEPGKREQARFLIENSDWPDERIAYELQTPLGIVKTVREDTKKLKDSGIVPLRTRRTTDEELEESTSSTMEESDEDEDDAEDTM